MLKLVNPPTEHQLHLAIVDHLRWRGVPDCFAFHCPNGGYRRPVEAALLKAMGVVAGVPDLLLLREGRLRGMEIKRPGGRLSADQVICHEQMRKAGAEITTVYDVDEALDRLAAWGLLR